MKVLIPILIGLLVVGCGKKEPSISRDEIVELETRKALRHRFDSNPASKGAIIDSLVLQKEGENKYVGSVEITDPDGSKIKLDLEVTDHGGKIFFETKMPQKSISEKPESLPDNLIVDPILEKAIRKKLKKPEGKLTEVDLQNLKVLVLNRTQITDAGLKEVAKLPKLVRLWLGSTQITDAGLKEVAKLQKLETLNLNFTQITDAGLKELAKVQNLTKLKLYDTKITDAGLKEVAKLPKLVRLWLGSTQITDAGLKVVAKLQNLTVLSLSYTKITDEGLKDVAKLQNLERLLLNNTQITKAGVAELKKALPNCYISSP